MSSDDTAISARELGKDYRLGELTDVRRFVLQKVARDRAMQIRRPDFHALDELDFDVRRGEAVAILGENGSGKSTLVQLIAGISAPSWGRLEVTGRVLPLLEVGAGFHAELTGRENVTLFGTILGLSRREIKDAMPAISAFGGIDEAHMDTPIKRFSTGMQSRLSFAVAMSFPADIYIFDEVMAVVDDHFRAIAAEEIKQFHRQGRTVLFISHDLDQVQRLCERGIWLDRGKMRMDGPIEDVASAYAESQESGADAETAAV
jgi:ABC-type polysaccharide/polyol phosphate transport system ATPase subunit